MKQSKTLISLTESPLYLNPKQLNTVKEMNDIELRDNIAFHMGWKKRIVEIPHEPLAFQFVVWDRGAYEGNDNPFLYSTSLDDIHEAEMSLTEPQLKDYYQTLTTLYKEYYPTNYNTIEPNQIAISAPARIRAEAFILVKGVYKEL